MKRSVPTLAALLCAGSFISAPVHALETVIRYPLVTQRNLSTVTWTGTQFVAAGEYGAVLRSPDGNVWTAVELPGSPPISSSAAGAGKIVLTSEKSTLFTSPDGIVWSTKTVPAQYPPFTSVDDIAFNGVAFRATSVGSGSNWSSPDGEAWTLIPQQGATARLAVHNTEFIAWEWSGSEGNPQMLFRNAGSGWSATTTNLLKRMQSLVWAGVRYVSVGPAGAAATSTDGTTWTLRTTGVTANLAHVIWTGSLAVAVGAGGTIITSPNGATWTVQDSKTTADLTAVASSGTSIVAVGKGGIITRSTDGTSWSAAQGTAPLADVNGVAWAGEYAVAVGPEGTLISSDGLSWTKTTATSGPNSQNFRLVAGPVSLVASDFSGLWMASPEVPAWVKVGNASQFGTPGAGVVWDGQKFVALVYEMNRQATGWNFFTTSSLDGFIWTPNKMQEDSSYWYMDAGPVNDLVFTGSRYLSYRSSSPDGITWTRTQQVPRAEFLFRTTDGILGVSRNGAIYVSENDGGSWTPSVSGFPDFSIGRYLDSVVWTGSRVLGTLMGDSSFEGIWEGGPGRPWTKIHDKGGISMAWTGTRAIVATGKTIFTFENPDSGLPMTWQLWRQNYFNAAQLNDPGISGPLADADKDGSINALEFVTGTSPVSRAAAPSFTVLPAQGNQGARFQWRQDTGRTGVTVHAEVSSDLDVWDEVTPSAIDGAAGGVRTMQAAGPAGLRSLFFRLRVVLTEG